MSSARKKPILLVDDEPDYLHSLSLTLRLAGLTNLTCCSDSREVATLLEEQEFSLAIVDLIMPHLSGEELLAFIRLNYPQIPVLILTGLDQVESAVRCIKAGAFDYCTKVTESERLIAGILRALQTTDLQEERNQLRSSLLSRQLTKPEVFAHIVTSNPQMQMVFKYLEAISKSPEPVLITGESGVGKEQIAQALHQLTSPEAPWVAVNVAGLDDAMFSDTLFGHERGSFTGADNRRAGMVEKAEGGILFLDEIGDLQPESQVKLLRLLQEGEYYPLGSDKPKRVTLRILAATNMNLEEQQNKGTFRKDLFYRLCAHQVEIPPLRERKDDIPQLLDYFLAEAAETMGKKKPSYPPELKTLLSLHSYPGNIRELRAMIYDAVSIHQGKMLSMDSFRQSITRDNGSKPMPTDSVAEEQLLGFYQTLPTLKQAADLLVAEAMKRTAGNQAMAARLLGIAPPSLSNRLKKSRTP